MRINVFWQRKHRVTALLGFLWPEIPSFSIPTLSSCSKRLCVYSPVVKQCSLFLWGADRRSDAVVGKDRFSIWLLVTGAASCCRGAVLTGVWAWALFRKSTIEYEEGCFKGVSPPLCVESGRLNVWIQERIRIFNWAWMECLLYKRALKKR